MTNSTQQSKHKTIVGIVVSIVALGLAGVLFFYEPGPSRNVARPPIAKESSVEIERLIREPLGNLSISYPLNGAVFPPEFPPPVVSWIDRTAVATRWIIAFRADDGRFLGDVRSTVTSLTLPSQLWIAVKNQNGRAVTMLIAGFPPSGSTTNQSTVSAVSSATIVVSVSLDPVGAPILYRDVPLPFIFAVKNPDTIRWRLGNIGSTERPPVVLSNLPVCGNCHSASADGSVLGLDIDYANDKGSYALVALRDSAGRPLNEATISRSNIITWSDYQREDREPTYGLLSQVSPDGRYVVSTVKDRSIFVPKDDYDTSQLFFPIKGILAVYDRETRQFAALPGADDRAFVHSAPCWSPDGKEILFSRARAAVIDESTDDRNVLITHHLAGDFLEGRREFKYDLYRVPFNGGQGGAATPLPGASQNGMSNYFGRYSPDGRWIVFCRAQNFMLLQPDSELMIMPSDASAPPRRMICNTEKLNSWHSFSPNGRWLVFSSKADSPFTSLRLTHIDESGVDSPAVRLDAFVIDQRAANIPEFVNLPLGHTVRLKESFLDSVNYRRQGDELVREQEPENALKFYAKAIELDANDILVRVHYANALAETGQTELAEAQYKDAIERLEKRDAARQTPDSPSAGLSQAEAEAQSDSFIAYYNYGLFQSRRRRFDDAVVTLTKLTERSPASARAVRCLGKNYAELEDYEKAAKAFERAVELEGGNAHNHLNLGRVLEALGRTADAKASYVHALNIAPKDDIEFDAIAKTLAGKSIIADELFRYFESCANRFPKSPYPWLHLGNLHIDAGDRAKAIEAYETARRLDSSIDYLDLKIQELKKTVSEP